MTRTVNTYCRICLASCGIEVEVDDAQNRVVAITPDRENPYTWRDFCRKGKTAHEVAEHPNRITTPMRRVGDKYVPATYAEAIADIAARLNAIIDQHGADAVGTYHGNPMGFSFATTGFWTGLLDAIGTKNRFWVGSIDQNNAHIVAEELYGSELVALVPDIEECDCFLLVGMDPAVSKFNWLENNPNGWNRVLDRVRGGADLIVVDPRRSISAGKAKTHVAVLPGEDWAFLLGVVKVIFEERLETPSTAVPIDGIDRLRRLAGQVELSELAHRCGVDVPTITDVARRFATARTAMCVTHTGVAHNEFGTLGEWLGQVLNLITDRTDQPGGRRFERGYVDLAKVMALFAPPVDHKTRIRGSRAIVGFHALSEMPDEITTPGPGQIKAGIVAFGNPVVSGPDGKALDDAFAQLDLLVAIDLVQRESHRHAHWLIPGTHWLERGELSPLLGGLQERPYVHYARQALDKPDGVLEEWEFFTELALAMKRNLFGRPGVNGFIKFSRAVARLTRRPKLAMNPEWTERLLVAFGRELKFSDIVGRKHGWLYREKAYGDLAKAVKTPQGRVRIAPDLLVDRLTVALAAGSPRSADYPLLLVNKRVREAMNSWLNESPGLHRPRRDTVVEIHPDDAANANIHDGDTVTLRSATGAIELRAQVTDDMRPGVVCVPHGWGGRTFDPARGEQPQSFGANRNLLVDNRRIDPLSQTPAFNSTAVCVESVNAVGAAPTRSTAAAAGD